VEKLKKKTNRHVQVVLGVKEKQKGPLAVWWAGTIGCKNSRFFWLGEAGHKRGGSADASLGKGSMQNPLNLKEMKEGLWGGRAGNWKLNQTETSEKRKGGK